MLCGFLGICSLFKVLPPKPPNFAPCFSKVWLHVTPGDGYFQFFVKASFRSASLFSLPITFNSSTNWVPAAPPLTVLKAYPTFAMNDLYSQ